MPIWQNTRHIWNCFVYIMKSQTDFSKNNINRFIWLTADLLRIFLKMYKECSPKSNMQLRVRIAREWLMILFHERNWNKSKKIMLFCSSWSRISMSDTTSMMIFLLNFRNWQSCYPKRGEIYAKNQEAVFERAKTFQRMLGKVG